MEENKAITLGDMIKQIISENQLSEVDETAIRKMLEEKAKKEEDKVCLVSIIEIELEKAIKSGQIYEENTRLYKSVFENIIKKSEIGNMPARELSDLLIRKFVLQAGKIYEKDRTRLKCFTGMLQTGLNKMEENDMLDFVPNKHVYKNYLMCSSSGIRYINNPYTNEETVRINEWINLHPDDIRALALGLWFSGDVSFLEIANLKKEDAHKGIFRKWERARLISKALELNPQNGNYVFMIINEGNLEKLTAQGFMMKLYHVCNRLEIEYKRINRNEVIVCKD